ncbi:uncharacterized protein LOC122506365 [Leptopilina heterotoma]|uniref:uncharacterized protein LOC122506365 n=1 Tax=Leptopilina heterotoma TaxID=63436 RepID=UPI001CA9D04B|nr:uncharacterized protein LOC122506365 [Leptopilina heterotoma]
MESDTDENRAKIFKRLHEELTLKKFLKAREPLITITEAEKRSTSELLCAEMSSPRLVVYVEDGGIVSAFIVADKEVRIKISNPNIEKALLSLFASYFAWNIKYPSAYVNTLSYLDQEILNNQNHKQTAVHKFTRKMKSRLNIHTLN